MKIFLLDTPSQTNKIICDYFISNNDEIVNVTNNLDLLEYLKKERYDLFILNMESPLLDNHVEIITTIRDMDTTSPIIIINGLHKLDILKSSYENGCTEYLKKPFYLYELQVKLTNIFNKEYVRSNIYFEKDFYYNKNTKQFYHNETPIYLRPKEKRLSEILLNNLNSLVKYDVIIDYVWNENGDMENYPLRQLLARLRQALPYNIINVRARVGYTMINQDIALVSNNNEKDSIKQKI